MARVSEQREDSPTTLDHGVSRSEEAIGEEWKLKVLNERSLRDRGVLLVYCPVHPNHLMTPIKVRSGPYGDNITLQCHYVWSVHLEDSNGQEVEKQKMCLLLATFLKEVGAYYRPGDILPTETWISAREYVQKVNGGYVEDEKSSPEKFVIEEAPPRPWSRAGTVRSQVFDFFWQCILEKGQCTLEDLIAHWKTIRPESELPKLYRAILNGEEPLTRWMENETGYIVKYYGKGLESGIWKVVGRREQGE